MQLHSFAAIVLLATAELQAVTIPTVPVGNVGNAADTTGYGSVNYDYRIGTTEVTNAQYTAFLNSKATSDPLGLYNPGMGSDLRGGITRDGSDGSYTYAVKANMGNKPVNWVSWYDSVRFANWLNNGQGNGDTETGAYTLLGFTPEPSNYLTLTRNAGATWYVPTEDEWYKAAYYDPTLSGDTGDYWDYPTQSNTDPVEALANAIGDIDNPGSNVANYSLDSPGWSGRVTTVGSAGPLSESFYGTSDQGGNVYEWFEAPLVLDETMDFWLRFNRGGAYPNSAGALHASATNNDHHAAEQPLYGFRVATIPEPSTYVMAAMGILALLFARRRKR